MKKTFLPIALAAMLVTGCSGLGLRMPTNPAHSASAAPGLKPVAAAPVPLSLVKGEGRYLGVYEPEGSSSYSQVSSFAQRIGRRPNIALYFSGWGEEFQEQFAIDARAHGALPMVQIDPATASLASIASGKYDGYLRSYAAAVRNYGSPVIIGFAHEPDGTWYRWGYNHVSPAVWIAAWRHVVSVFRDQSARNVIWSWTMNDSSTSPYPLHAWWPGRRYVTWVGIDGYYASPADTFNSLFGNSVAQIRSFTRDPILISETAVGPATGKLAGDVENLFEGIRRDHLIGPVWFDASGPAYRQDWRLEDYPVELAAFRKALRKYM
jgi:Glycosyl hydrolase family 26